MLDIQRGDEGPGTAADANLSRAFFISLFGPILGNPMVLVIMLELDMVAACRSVPKHQTMASTSKKA